MEMIHDRSVCYSSFGLSLSLSLRKISCYNKLKQTCLGDFAQFLLADVIQVFLHLRSCLAHLPKGELRVDKHFGHHGLRWDTQGWKILFNNRKELHESVKLHNPDIYIIIPTTRLSERYLHLRVILMWGKQSKSLKDSSMTVSLPSFTSFDILH